jgi:hypothetical protein
MMRGSIQSREQDKPVPGWACVAIGAGFITLVTAGLVLVRLAAG